MTSKELEKIYRELEVIHSACAVIQKLIHSEPPGPPEEIPEPVVEPMFNFEQIYSLYPKKVGKSMGIKKCKSQIKNLKDYHALAAAISKFKEYHRTRGTLPEYLPHFSTFMSSWRDWLDPTIGAVDLTGMRKTETTSEYLERERKIAEEEAKLRESGPSREEIEAYMHRVRSNMRA